MRNLLLSQKKEIFVQSQREQDIDMDGDETDAIQGNMLAEMSNRLSTRASFKLKQIEGALQRIDKQTYGLCQDCNEAIPEKRLILNPYFQTCVSCAEDRERQEKQGRKL